ncbi:MAG: sensor histidine kinase, partial [Erythrobacter sp. 34-65-8]
MMLSIVLLWLCYFLITTVRGSIIGLDFDGETLQRRAMVCGAGILVTTVMWLVIRLVDRQAVWIKALVSPLVAIPAALAIAQANQWAFADIQSRAIQKIGAEQGIKLRQDEAGNILLDLPEAGPTGAAQVGAGENLKAAVGGWSGTITLAKAPAGFDRWRQLSGVALSPYFLLLAWAALYLALLAGAQARAAERREERFRSAAKAAELRSLRYQVNPHFLFNTLNSLSSMVMTGKTEQAEAMIQTIASFYRHSLADDASADVMLADEFALQQHYLDIEAVRFPDRLRPVF